MEDKKEVMFYGYSDGKAIHIYNLLNLFIPTSITVIIAIILSILSLVIKEYYIMFVWIIPFILFISLIIDIIVRKYNDKTFLKDSKKKHSYRIENGNFFKNDKGININNLKIYKFKKYIFIEFWKSYCRVLNEDFVGITREEFLSLFTINKITHRAKFIKKYKCPCCGYYTLDNEGMYDICPVCFWEDNDEVENPNEYDDCNKISLAEARKNYLEFGASTKDVKKYCRKPKNSEKQELIQILTLIKFKSMFIKEYASDVPEDKLYKYVISNGNYIWHLFSWELLSSDKYLEGDKAKKAYDLCDKSNAIVFAETPKEEFFKITDIYKTSKDIEEQGEVYVFAEDMSWVYINTHEESIGLGPYFIKK